MRHFFSVLFTALAAAPAAADDAIPFAIETVDTAAAPSICCVNVSVDSKLNPRFFFQGYRTPTRTAPTYAARHDGQWTRESFRAGFGGSLALDREGQPHLTWTVRYLGAPDTLFYATLVDGGWQIEIVDRFQMRAYSSIALDSQQRPSIAYMKYSQFGFPNESDIHYRVRMGDGSWQEPRGLAFGAPLKIFLALDAADRPLIAFPAFGIGLSVRAWVIPSQSGSWIPEALGPYSPLNGVSKPRFDPAGVPHLALVELDSQDVWYATRGPVGWTFEVAAQRDQAEFPALGIDAGGNPHVAFYDPGLHEMAYAHREGGQWTQQTVETGVTLVTQPSIDVDVNGNPHIAYVLGDARLRHAVGRLNVRARAFVAGGNRVVRSDSRRPDLQVQIEPDGGSFDLSQVDLGSITLSRDGASDALAVIDAAIDRDRDRNGVDEIRARFDYSALLQWLGDANGVLSVTLRGRVGGSRMAAPLGLEVESGHAPVTRVSRDALTGETRLEIGATAGGAMDVRVFDLSGRLVSRASRTGSDTGPFAVRLVEGESGKDLRPGIYFYRIDGAQGIRRGRFVVLR